LWPPNIHDERLYFTTDADVNCLRMLPIRARQCTTIAFRMSSTRALSRKRMPASVIPPGVAMFSRKKGTFYFFRGNSGDRHFRPSAQLDERIAEMVKKSGVTPRTLKDLPDEIPWDRAERLAKEKREREKQEKEEQEKQQGAGEKPAPAPDARP
jgi:hypothetical protein